MHKLLQVPLLHDSLAEQQEAVRKVMIEAQMQLGTQLDVPAPFRVSLAHLPKTQLAFENNLFSTFFIAVLHLLQIAPARRQIYAALNHLFRAWVTSADNLLDNEDKVTLPLRMSGRPRIITQVVVIMIADRIMQALLDQSVDDGVFSRAEVQILARRSLQALLPSAAEEGMEEAGFDNRTSPEYILTHLHPLKTGILFHLPMIGPEAVETNLDQARLDALKRAMMNFGIGCQLLDDIRDLARDAAGQRANYLLACLARDNPTAFTKMPELARQQGLDSRLYQTVPDDAAATAHLARHKLTEAVVALDKLGITGFTAATNPFLDFLFRRLDLEDLR